jgi:ketosteroid isomerase-like protein
LNREDASRWFAAYVEAWKSRDRDRIGALFTNDAEYRYYPGQEPLRGRAAIVAAWLEVQDAEGTFETDYRVMAVDGEVAVATGSTTYLAHRGGPVERLYDNCFVIRFGDDGRCREYVEWYQARELERLVLQLRVVEDLPPQEVARQSGVSEPEVIEVVRGALRRLQTEVGAD